MQACAYLGGRDSSLKYLVGWEDSRTGIVYNEFWEDAGPILEVASSFQKQKESERVGVTVKVKSVTELPPTPPQHTSYH